MASTYNARIKVTGKTVVVYRLNKIDKDDTKNPQRGLLCNYNDCSTNYKNSEVEILKENK